MAEAGIGAALVPLMPDGSVTRGHRVGVRPLPGLVRPIHSGVLLRRGVGLPAAAAAFLDFLRPPGPPDGR